MKTKELIAELLKVDPTGEGEVCIGNSDVYFVEHLPAYYDGCLQRLIKDDDGHVIAGKFTGSGNKISIRPLSIYDAIFDDNKFPVTYEGMSEEKAASYEKSIAERRRQTDKIHDESEQSLFAMYMAKRLSPHDPAFDLDDDEIIKIARDFYAQNMYHEDPMPADIAKLSIGHSWYSKRCLQWDRGIAVDLADGKLILGFTDQYTD